MQNLGKVLEAELPEGAIYMIPLESLCGPADSPRIAGVDQAHVELLLATEASLPPILVHRPTMRVVDGMHRLQAAVRRGEQNIPGRFFDGPEADVFILSVQSNVRHGLALSLADRTAAAARIVRSHPHLSDRAIARISGLSPKTVAAVRRRSTEEGAQSNVRVGDDGRVRPLDVSGQRKKACQLIAAHPDMPLREVARTVGISVATAHDVRKRMRSGREPVPARYREDDVPEGKHKDRVVRLAPPLGDPAQGECSGQSDHDLLELRRILKKDPSIRFTETGRALLRLFDAQELLGAAGDRLVDGVPPHWAETIAELAEGCASSWRAFAVQVRRNAATDNTQANG
ncbi:hypothetical protein ACFZC6_17695 [Streptomyces ossamyceticus]|uniref:ParB-like N-terminal domain-containing protein n=1 Tax=Streptomyces ossamyceticus TaxID=249581 RepID=A0ABV2US16_9ACTN